MNRFDSQKKGRPAPKPGAGYMPVVVAKAVLSDDESAGLATAAEGTEEEYGTEADLPMPMPMDLDVDPPSQPAPRAPHISTAPIGLSLPPGSLEDTGLHLLPPEAHSARRSLPSRASTPNPQTANPLVAAHPQTGQSPQMARASISTRASSGARASIAQPTPAERLSMTRPASPAAASPTAAPPVATAARASVFGRGMPAPGIVSERAPVVGPEPVPKPGEPFDVESIELPSDAPPRKDSIPATGESPWWNEAKALRAAGEKAEALELLELLLSTQGAHAEARKAALELSFDLKLERSIAAHAPHVIRRLVKQEEMREVCAVYRSLRTAWPKLELSEAALVNVVLAGDHEDELSVVVDATNELVRGFPRGGNTARALLATAKQQLKSGRNKRAKDTLAFLIKNYPNDPSAALAQQKIGQISE